MEYGGGEIKETSEYLENCLEKVNSPYLFLWFPDKRITFDEAKKKFLDTENLPEPISLEDFNSMTVNTFYESITKDGSVCIRTAKSLWP